MKKFTKSQRLYLYQFCADMINSNLPIYDSIIKLKKEGETVIGKGFVNKLNYLLDKMANKESIASVFDGMVPKSELSLIYSSEKSGALANGFTSIVEVIKYKDQLMSKVIKSITFPLIMLALSLIVIAGYAVKVFPAFERVLPVTRWPVVTSSLYEFGLALYNGLWVYILVAVILLTIITRVIMANVTGLFRDRFMDRVVPFSTFKQLNASIILNSLSGMLKNKIPINDALTILSLNANRWLKSHINIMKVNMAKGQNYGEALNTGLLNVHELLNISLYSALPSFHDVLTSVSEKSKININDKMDKLAGLLKSFSTLILGGCVIWVFIALFSLSDQLSKMSQM
ncbi:MULTISPECIES: type II secretion system F family protein [Providencia]|uniref:Type II secretion system F family protein n=8 Tax=Providencia TaxID=586 RepID=A0AA42K131_9GAMM|nr:MULTISPECIES: type II secretion system F family protein [Providencia]APC11925.1 Toxin coregulated pilus biosynthesis protein E [Providencia rettgeri]AVL75242.1 type II secretion protein F [Providencia rettgeri]EIU7555002.1 type II secretion system F family protein [Providencia rettgeri]EIU9517193.1 type II secretion system F family protein [Providencia rettgeri]EJD6041356.1 type II secretion system F family protein [Providencia rettgeri]